MFCSQFNSGINVSVGIIFTGSRSQWPRSLRCGSTAARLLVLRVRIPPGHGCLPLVSVVCCQVEVSVTGQSVVQRSPTKCGVSDRGTSQRSPRLTGSVEPRGKKHLLDTARRSTDRHRQRQYKYNVYNQGLTTSRNRKPQCHSLYVIVPT